MWLVFAAPPQSIQSCGRLPNSQHVQVWRSKEPPAKELEIHMDKGQGSERHQSENVNSDTPGSKVKDMPESIKESNEKEPSSNAGDMLQDTEPVNNFGDSLNNQRHQRNGKGKEIRHEEHDILSAHSANSKAINAQQDGDALIYQIMIKRGKLMKLQMQLI